MSTELQREFELADAGRSQNEKLRDYLKAHPLSWVPMPELAKVISPTGNGVGIAAHSRVNDCRKKYGMHIERQVKLNSATGQRVVSYLYDPNLPSNFGLQRNRQEAVTA